VQNNGFIGSKVWNVLMIYGGLFLGMVCTRAIAVRRGEARTFIPRADIQAPLVEVELEAEDSTTLAAPSV